MGQPDSRKRWFRRHRRLALLAVTLGASGLAVVGAELAARALRSDWAPIRAERTDFWSYDESLGWAHRPGQRGKFSHRDFSVEVRINSRGFRDDEYSENRNDKSRMLVVGDSYAWGFGVEHHERFSELLEARHTDWEIINTAVSGYGTDQEYLQLASKGMSYAPDAVLLLFSTTDFEDNASRVRYWYDKPYFSIGDGGALELRNVPVPRAPALRRLNRFLLGKSYLWRSMYLGIPAIHRQMERGKQDDGESDDSSKSKFEVTRELLRAMDELCVQRGARFIVVSTPLRNPKKRKFMKRLAEEERFPFLALDAAFADLDSEGTFAHDPHWNAEGHAAAARAIDEFLADPERVDPPLWSR